MVYHNSDDLSLEVSLDFCSTKSWPGVTCWRSTMVLLTACIEPPLSELLPREISFDMKSPTPLTERHHCDTGGFRGGSAISIRESSQRDRVLVCVREALLVLLCNRVAHSLQHKDQVIKRVRARAATTEPRRSRILGMLPPLKGLHAMEEL